MKLLSEKLNNIQPKRRSIISDVAASTGMDENAAEKLYENFEQKFGKGNIDAIVSEFEKFTEVKVFDFAEFSDTVLKLCEPMIDPAASVEEKNNSLSSIIEYVYTKTESEEVDTFQFLKIVSFILGLCGENVPEFAGIEQPETEILADDFETKQKLYESAEILLTKNNKRWGFSNMLDNASNELLFYIKNKIEEQEAAKHLMSHRNASNSLFSEIIRSGRINPALHNIGTLKTYVLDIQEFVFNACCLVDGYFTAKEHFTQYISQEKLSGYVNAADTVYAAISSSRKNSLFPEIKNYGNNVCLSMFSTLRLDTEKAGFNTFNITAQNANTFLVLIKMCISEFSLENRKKLNTYITKAATVFSSIHAIENKALRMRLV